MKGPSGYGELMTVEEFKERVKDGSFTDYDGFANPATVQETRLHISPSGAWRLSNKVQYVVWYNK